MMGLNGGPQDAGNLADKLARVLVDSASDSLLDLYNRQRRTVAFDVVQEQSMPNTRRLEAKYPEARGRNFEELAAIAADSAQARQYLLRTSVLARQACVAARTLEAA
jgi:3-(3-hydroxy-phenyl)propionate hydroxylase